LQPLVGKSAGGIAREETLMAFGRHESAQQAERAN
jgi:hypothetical protein